MPRRLLLALIALVAAPLLLLGWVSSTTMASAQQRARNQLAALLRSRLIEIDKSSASLFQTYSRKLTAELNSSHDVIDRLRQLRRSDPIVRQGIFVSANGQLLHPPRPNPDDSDAVALYAALPGLIGGRAQSGNNFDQYQSSNAPNQTIDSSSRSSLLQRLAQAKVAQREPSRTQQAESLPIPSQQAQNSPQQQTFKNAPTVTSSDAYWQVWYMDQGIQLIHWTPRSDGASVGILLERSRWTSDLTAQLPETAATTDHANSTADLNHEPSHELIIGGFTALVDESKQVVYRWGDEGERSPQPTALIAMSSPLSAWQWEFHSNAPLFPQYSSAPVYLSLLGIGVLLLVLGAYVLTTVRRQMQIAASRVSFAGQVSHELRTPLTNIRLYAELAQSDLESSPHEFSTEKISQRLAVIDSESKRLSRLVSGVLEMIRIGKVQRGPRLMGHCPDELIAEILDQFSPSFQMAGIEVSRQLDADRMVQLDADIFDVVLVNLLSNVQKYASAGKSVTVQSSYQANDLVVTVADSGPGIGRRHRRKVFQPFSRLDDSIEAPSGTGIGLTIARAAAKRHGGDLSLLPSDAGACFELRIPVGAVADTAPICNEQSDSANRRGVS